MPSPVLLHHVVGDLTVGKPELSELLETDTLDVAAKAIVESAEGAVPVWLPKVKPTDRPSSARFVGLVSSVDLVAFIAAAEGAGDGAMSTTPVAGVVERDPGLLREVDPGTRLIDALEMMKQGVRRLMVRKTLTWKGVSKRFSILLNGKWLKNIEGPSSSSSNAVQPESSSAAASDKFCCLSREDVMRFLIGCLGALAPIPLSQISQLGAINPHYSYVEATVPALEAIQKIPHDPRAIAVVETNQDGLRKIIGDISAYKLQKCDYLTVGWVIANLSAGLFVSGADENGSMPLTFPDSLFSALVEEPTPNRAPRQRKFSSRSIGFFSSSTNQASSFGRNRSMYRGQSALLVCKSNSSLAAVMAQMLSHRATHVWVTDEQSDGLLVGIVGYNDVFSAFTKIPSVE